MKLWQKNVLLLVIALIVVLIPLVFVSGEYGGADGMAEDQIVTDNPDYEPWFSPIFEPQSGEIESLLFVSQAAIGALVIGFGLGRISAKPKKEKSE